MKIETTLAEMKQSFNWEEAVKCANRDSRGRVHAGGEVTDGRTFSLDDVAEVIGSLEGENDVSSWIAVFCMGVGDFAYLEAGCDYTGWG